MYSNCYCSCSFKAEIIKIGQSSHKMYCNNILDFQVSTTILNACTKKSGKILKAPRRSVCPKHKKHKFLYVEAGVINHIIYACL